MVPVKRTSEAWNMCTEDKAINVGNYKPFRPPPPEASGSGYWTTEGVWMKTEKDENEHGPIGPKPPPPGAVGSGRWNSDGEWIEGGKKKRTTPPPPPPLPPASHKEKNAFQTMTRSE
eukprot:1618760-Amphidinium_carterae.1